MNPFPGPHSVLVLDNASIHKSQRLCDICNEKGVRLEFLPSYSPDYNPVRSYVYFIIFIIISNDLKSQYIDRAGLFLH